MLLGVYVLSVQQLSAQKKSTTLPKECDAVNLRADVVTRNERNQYGSTCQLLANVQELLCHEILQKVREKALLVVSSAVRNLWWLALVARDTGHGIRSTGFSLDVKKNLTIPEGTVR